MPLIEVKMFKGRTIEQKRKLVASMTDAVVSSIGCKPDAVRITLHEMAKEDYAIGGVLTSEKSE
jgi:4-oxalocrotonate tautomerase